MAAKPRVIFLSTDVSVKGGTSRVMADLVSGLSQDFDLTVVALEGRETAYPYPENVELVSLEDGLGRGGSKAWRTLNSLRMAPQIARLARARQAAAVISFLPRANIANVAARKLARPGYGCILCERNFNSIQYAGSLLGRSMKLIMRTAYPRADHVVPNAVDLAADLNRSFGVPWAKLRVIYNPLPLDRIAGLSREPLDPSEAAWFDSQGPVVLTVGRLIEQKNQALLVQAFADVRQLLPCRLLILGEGLLAASLKEMAENLGVGQDVALWGWRDNPFKYMARATVFALTSDYEGFPNVLVEAMASGCAVVSTDCPSGPREILDDGAFGALAPMGDRPALARELLALLCEPARRQALASAGKTRTQLFDAPVVIEQYKTLIMEHAA